MGKWTVLTDLRDQLEIELSGDGFKAVWEQGKSLELETVVTELLVELADE